MKFMDAGFILPTYLLSRTECNIVSDRTYGTVRTGTERNVYLTVASRALARSVNPCSGEAIEPPYARNSANSKERNEDIKKREQQIRRANMQFRLTN